jgi:hypothetical protein
MPFEIPNLNRTAERNSVTLSPHESSSDSRKAGESGGLHWRAA